MRKILAAFAAFLTFSTALAFSDVGSGDPHKNAIEYLARHSVVAGFSDGEFKSRQRITRAELAKIVVGVRGENPSPREFNSCFADVAGEWFARFVCSAKNENWIDGYSDGAFRPGAEVDRAEAAKIVVNALGVALDDSTKFSDVADEWFAPFANTMRARNLFDGTIFSAGQKITRGEVAEIIFRALVVKNFGESKFISTLVDDFDFDISPAAIVASTLDFANSENANLRITKWRLKTDGWTVQPTLEFNGKQFSFATPQNYAAALQKIRNHFRVTQNYYFDEAIDEYIAEFETAFKFFSATDTIGISPSPVARPFSPGAAIGNSADFTDTDLADESAVAARGGPAVKIGAASIYIGYETLPPLNKNPVLVSFTDGKQNWVRRDYETSSDESVGYGLLADGENLFAVFTSRGVEENINFDFRRFAKKGWLFEYGEGSGKQIAVIAKINSNNGDVLAATFLSARRSSGETEIAVVKDLRMSGENLVVQADVWHSPRRTSGQPMDFYPNAENPPFDYEIEFTPDLRTAVRAEAPGFGR